MFSRTTQRVVRTFDPDLNDPINLCRSRPDDVSQATSRLNTSTDSYLFYRLRSNLSLNHRSSCETVRELVFDFAPVLLAPALHGFDHMRDLRDDVEDHSVIIEITYVLNLFVEVLLDTTYKNKAEFVTPVGDRTRVVVIRIPLLHSPTRPACAPDIVLFLNLAAQRDIADPSLEVLSETDERSLRHDHLLATPTNSFQVTVDDLPPMNSVLRRASPVDRATDLAVIGIRRPCTNALNILVKALYIDALAAWLAALLLGLPRTPRVCVIECLDVIEALEPARSEELAAAAIRELARCARFVAPITLDYLVALADRIGIHTPFDQASSARSRVGMLAG